MDGWGSVLGRCKNCLTLVESRDHSLVFSGCGEGLSCKGVNPRFEPETYQNRSGCAAHLTAARDYQHIEASDGWLCLYADFSRGRIFITVGAVAAAALSWASLLLATPLLLELASSLGVMCCDEAVVAAAFWEGWKATHRKLRSLL